MDRQARYKPQAENDFLPMAEIIGIPANTVARGDYFVNLKSSEDFYDDTLGDRVYLAGKIWMALLLKNAC